MQNVFKIQTVIKLVDKCVQRTPDCLAKRNEKVGRSSINIYSLPCRHDIKKTCYAF